MSWGHEGPMVTFCGGRGVQYGYWSKALNKQTTYYSAACSRVGLCLSDKIEMNQVSHILIVSECKIQNIN